MQKSGGPSLAEVWCSVTLHLWFFKFCILVCVGGCLRERVVKCCVSVCFLCVVVCGDVGKGTPV